MMGIENESGMEQYLSQEDKAKTELHPDQEASRERPEDSPENARQIFEEELRGAIARSNLKEAGEILGLEKHGEGFVLTADGQEVGKLSLEKNQIFPDAQIQGEIHGQPFEGNMRMSGPEGMRDAASNAAAIVEQIRKSR